MPKAKMKRKKYFLALISEESDLKKLSPFEWATEEFLLGTELKKGSKKF